MVKTKVYLNGDLIDINGDNQSDDENILRSNILDGVLNRIILKDSESYTQDGITVTLNSPEKGNIRIFFNNIQTRTISAQLTNVMSLKKGSYVLKSDYIGNVYRKIILYLYDCTTEEKIAEIDNNHSSAKFTLDNDNDNLMVFATITGERFGDSNEYFINPSITFEKYKNESFVAGAKTNSTLSNDIDNINNLIIDKENKILKQNDVIKNLITDGVQNYFPLKKFEEEEIQGCILTRYPNGYSLYIDIPAGELYDPVSYSVPISDNFSLKKGKYSIEIINHTPTINVSFIIKDANNNIYSDDFELIDNTSNLIGYLEFEITYPTIDNHIFVDPYICLQGYSSLGSEMNAMNNLELTKRYNNVSKNKLDKTGGDLTGDLSVHDSSTSYPQSRLTKWGVHHYINDGAYIKMGIGGSPQHGMMWYKPSSNSSELSYKLPDSSGTLALTSDNVQADWNQTDNSASDYIKNKPTIPSIPDVSDKMDKNNPTGTGSLSINRRENVSVGSNSSTLGVNCSATGTGSHAQGNSTTASGNYSFAEGNQTSATGHNSHAGGVGTQALDNMATFGLYNNPQSGDLFEVGNGTSSSLKSNALRVTSDGEVIDGHGNKISDINNINVPTKTSDLTNDSNFVSDNNYIHTDNNYTDNEKTKLSNIESNAQVNKIEKIKVNGTEQTVIDKEVSIDLSGYVTNNDSRLSDSRPASDVYNWAKAIAKPSYNWNEIGDKPETFTPSSHIHTSSDITTMANYSKPNTTSAITTSDTLNQAIGKLEKAIEIGSTGSNSTKLPWGVFYVYASENATVLNIKPYSDFTSYNYSGNSSDYPNKITCNSSGVFTLPYSGYIQFQLVNFTVEHSLTQQEIEDITTNNIQYALDYKIGNNDSISIYYCGSAVNNKPKLQSVINVVSHPIYVSANNTIKFTLIAGISMQNKLYQYRTQPTLMVVKYIEI